MFLVQVQYFGTTTKYGLKSVTKVSKLKVRKFWGLILTFVEVTGKKFAGSLYGVPTILNRFKISKIIKVHATCLLLINVFSVRNIVHRKYQIYTIKYFLENNTLI